MYRFVGVEFWGSGEKSLSDFKKAFARQIPPKEMDVAFKYIKAEYKDKFPTKLKAKKD